MPKIVRVAADGGMIDVHLDNGSILLLELESLLNRPGFGVLREDLEENDLVSYLGNNGAPFFYATSPLKGELSNQTSTELTLAGKDYEVIPNFHYSDDRGETFYATSISLPEYSIDSFGRAQYAKAYNFTKLAYVAPNSTNGIIRNASSTAVAELFSQVQAQQQEEQGASTGAVDSGPTAAVAVAFSKPDVSALTDIDGNGMDVAEVSFAPANPQTAGTSVTATVTLTGTAVDAGTYTFTLTSAAAGIAATGMVVVTANEASATAIITFTMPEADIADFTLTADFAV